MNVWAERGGGREFRIGGGACRFKLFFRGAETLEGTELEREFIVLLFLFLITGMADEIYDVFMMRRIGGEKEEDSCLDY
jgi:hypothetical protein